MHCLPLNGGFMVIKSQTEKGQWVSASSSRRLAHWAINQPNQHQGELKSQTAPLHVVRRGQRALALRLGLASLE